MGIKETALSHMSGAMPLLEHAVRQSGAKEKKIEGGGEAAKDPLSEEAVDTASDELLKKAKDGRYPSLKINQAFTRDEAGKEKLDLNLLEAGVKYYQKTHAENRSKGLALASVGALLFGGNALFASQREALLDETETLPILPKQIQRVFNFPTKLVKAFSEPALDAEQYAHLQQGFLPFILQAGRGEYEKLEKGRIVNLLTHVTKPLVWILNKMMQAFGAMKLASTALNSIEKADPEANPNPNLKPSKFLNDLAESGLKFFPLIKSLGDLNMVLNTSKGNTSKVVNGVAGLFTNLLLAKKEWNNFHAGLVQKNEDGSYHFTKNISDALMPLGLSENQHSILTSSVDKLISYVEGVKFKLEDSEDASDSPQHKLAMAQRTKAYSQIFKNLSFLGDNRGDIIQDQGTKSANLLRRIMSVLVDLPATSVLALKTFSLATKLAKHAEISDKDLELAEKAVLLKGSALTAEQLLVSAVENGVLRSKTDFGGSLADLEDLEVWRGRVNGLGSRLKNIGFIPFIGTIFEPFKKFALHQIKKKEEYILRTGITDTVPNIAAGPINEKKQKAA